MQVHASLLTRGCGPKNSNNRHLVNSSALKRSIRNIHFGSWPSQIIVYGNQTKQEWQRLSGTGHISARCAFAYLLASTVQRVRRSTHASRDHTKSSRLWQQLAPRIWMHDDRAVSSTLPEYCCSESHAMRHASQMLTRPSCAMSDESRRAVLPTALLTTQDTHKIH